tara:strand:- start:1750 stop:1962 length:213 start_codon:yes stop_codon:yes gene_type:complete
MLDLKKMRLRLEQVRDELEIDLERIIRQNQELEEISEELLGEKLADEIVEQVVEQEFVATITRRIKEAFE